MLNEALRWQRKDGVIPSPHPLPLQWPGPHAGYSLASPSAQKVCGSP